MPRIGLVVCCGLWWIHPVAGFAQDGGGDWEACFAIKELATVVMAHRQAGRDRMDFYRDNRDVDHHTKSLVGRMVVDAYSHPIEKKRADRVDAIEEFSSDWMEKCLF